MPSKQSTLGYVRPAQRKLTNFFGNPNGAKASAPQQSKLSFSNKSRASAKPEEDKYASVEQIRPRVKDEDTDMNNGEGYKATDPIPAEGPAERVTKSGVNANGSTPSPHAIRKRQASEDIREPSDEEPPIKRKRLQKGSKNRAVTDSPVGDTIELEAKSPMVKIEPATTQISPSKLADAGIRPRNGRKSVTFEDGAAKDDNTSKLRRKSTPMKSQKSDHAEKEDEPVKDEAVEATPSKQGHEASSSDKNGAEYDESELDEDADSEDEEKPEVAEKARKKVQTTLSSKANDPYPDWKPGEPVPYAALCTTFHKIEMTTKRLEISAHCSLFIRQVLRLTPQDLLPTVLLMINKLAADYTGIELGIGESLIMKSIGETTGRSLATIKADQKEIGDLGLVAAKSRSNQPTMFRPKPLTIRGVHQGLITIATIEGHGSQGRKVGEIKKLLSSADAHLAGKGGKGVDITKDKGGPSEAKYIIRALEGKMRLGLADKTVLVALSHAMVFHELSDQGAKAPSTDQLVKGEQILKSVYNEMPSYEVIVPAMLEAGLSKLRESCNLRPGVPLKPMLAKPTKSITEVLDRFEGKDFSCEYKYDGERAQIHFVAHHSDLKFATTVVPKAGENAKGVANIFSRNSEDLSKKYPDILEKLPTWVKEGTESFVLDCETVAWDLEEKKVLPFQQLMTRKRKDVKTEDITVKVCVFAFDILFLNGEALVNKPLRERRELLHSAFEPVESEFAFAQYGNTNVLEEIQTLLEESVKASCEGLMVKMLDGVESHYEPSRRSQNWLKVKKDYLSGVGDSLDLVVLGAYHGKGKRTSVYGAFLLACWNANSEKFETVCNIGTGFSEAVLEDLHAQLAPLIIDRPKPFYAHSVGNKDQPDVWFEPRFVWEVKTADLTISPRYRAAAESMDGDKGISLRFPRFLKVRDDKKPEEATTSHAIAEMYRNQEGVSKTKGPSVDDDFEY